MPQPQFKRKLKKLLQSSLLPTQNLPHRRQSRRLKQQALLQFLKQRKSLSPLRSEEHTSELQSLMRFSYAVFCLTTQNSYPSVFLFHFFSLTSFFHFFLLL